MKEMLSKSSRVYSVVKADLLDGILRAGAWIDVPSLADRVDVSPTPVRYALYELAGEGLIKAHDRQGFHTLEFDEESLRDLFQLRSCLFLAAAESAAPEPRSPEIALAPPPRADICRKITGLFLDLASASGRPQLRETIERLDDKLRLIQWAKLEIIPELEDEYLAIATTWKERNIARLIEIISSACHRRLLLVPEILDMLRRGRREE